MSDNAVDGNQLPVVDYGYTHAATETTTRSNSARPVHYPAKLTIN